MSVSVYQFLKDICEEDEPSVIGERVASVYWEGFLKYVNHHLGKFEPTLLSAYFNSKKAMRLDFL